MNILITSVGRRNYMVDYFKEAVAPYHGKIFCLNSNNFSPALNKADYFAISPLIHEENYKSFVLDYCKIHKINILISLFDIDIPVLASLKNALSEIGVTVVVCNEWVANMANDKWKTYDFLVNNNFLTKKCYINLEVCKKDIDSKNTNFPLFVKPRWGMGSLGVFKVDNIEELNFFHSYSRKVVQNSYLKYESAINIDESIIIQEELPGNEYGFDVINNLKGDYCTTIVKRKIAMRSGETDVAQVVEVPMLEDLGEKISKLLKHPANLDVDVFFDGTNAYILELNPRFGGGYPFSHASGVNLPKAIIKWYLNEKFEIEEFLKPKTFGVVMKGIIMIDEKINR